MGVVPHLRICNPHCLLAKVLALQHANESIYSAVDTVGDVYFILETPIEEPLPKHQPPVGILPFIYE
jgi:hypothetical protein